jgi:hypothetical protein
MTFSNKNPQSPLSQPHEPSFNPVGLLRRSARPPPPLLLHAAATPPLTSSAAKARPHHHPFLPPLSWWAREDDPPAASLLAGPTVALQGGAEQIQAEAVRSMAVAAPVPAAPPRPDLELRMLFCLFYTGCCLPFQWIGREQKKEKTERRRRAGVVVRPVVRVGLGGTHPCVVLV